MFGLSLTQMLPASFTVKNGLIILSKHIGDHENVRHEVAKYELRIDIKRKVFDVLVYHPGTKKPTYLNDVTEDGSLWYPVKYELPGHGHWYHFSEGAILIGLIQSMVEREVNTKDKADYVIVKYDDLETSIPCTIYLTTAEGKKIQLNHIIK